MALLEVLTRVCRRPTMLAANQASLDAQTDGDWVQTLLIDDVGRSVGWANLNLGRYAPHLEGDYIWILDDDDYCACPTFVADLRRIAEQHNPDVIMVRGDYLQCGVLPEPWEMRPTFTHIGSSCFVLKRHIWQAHASAWTPELGADFRMIDSVFDQNYRIYWHDCIVMRAQRSQSRGRPE